MLNAPLSLAKSLTLAIMMTRLTSYWGFAMHALQQWAVQDAKARLSEVIKKAEHEGPQMISVRGKPAVVMISQETYLALISQEGSLVDFFQHSPLRGVRLRLKRDKSTDRDVLL